MSNPNVGEFSMAVTPEPPKKNNNAKWIAAGIVAGLGLFGFMVQSSNNAMPDMPSQSISDSPTPTPKPQAKPDYAEDVYILSIHDAYPSSQYVSDRELLQLGYDVCSLFDAGVTAEEYAYLILEEFPYDTDAQELAAVVGGAAIGALCPQHGWMLD